MHRNKLNPMTNITEIDIKNAKLNFFSHYIIEELSEDLIKINEDMEKEELIEYIFNKYNFKSIVEGIKMSHNGDCTLMAHTCIRCYSESFFNINSINFTKEEGNMMMENRILKNENK